MPLLVTGSGSPVTVVAHGLGATVSETRALVGGVRGTKAFPEARGHGSAPPAACAGYEELAADLLDAADSVGATQAFGVSMGAHAVLRIVSRRPDRFERLVLYLPAAIDKPVRRTPALSAALARSDRAQVLAAVRRELGSEGDAQEAYAEARADLLLGMPSLPALLAALAADVPVVDRSVLSAVSADVLVIGQEGDDLHPADVARELAATLPRARLVLFDSPGVPFRERARFRALVADHLKIT